MREIPESTAETERVEYAFTLLEKERLAAAESLRKST